MGEGKAGLKWFRNQGHLAALTQIIHKSFSLIYELISQDFSPIFLPLSFPFYSTNKYILSISCIQTR